MLAGCYALMFVGEFDPRTATRADLARYLATSDMADVPPEELDAIIDRVAVELKHDDDFSASHATNHQRELLRHNAELLKHRWFVARVEQYAALPATMRAEFLDEQIAALLTWVRVDEAFAESAADSSGTGFFDDVERWTASESNEVLRSRMNLAVRDGIARWLSTHGLAEQSPALRRRLALVVAEGLNNGAADLALEQAAAEGDSEVLRDNGELLLEAWMLAQAEHYASLAHSQRKAFIDARLDEISRWPVGDLLNSPKANAVASPAVPPELGQMMSMFIERAEPVQQSQLRLLTNDVIERMIVRAWKAALGE